MILRRILALAALSCLSASLLAQQSPINWVPVPMSTPKAMQGALPTGAKASTDVLHISVSLPFRDAVGMQKFVDSVSNPKSPNYRQFITPAEVGQRFGLSLTTVNKVTNYLKSVGMNVRLVGKSRLSILADATVAQAQTAFNTSFEEYTPLVAGKPTGEKRFSFTTAPNVPAEISAYVGYVGGLENFTRPKSALVPSQLRTLYSLAQAYGNGFQGQGRTVAISNFDGYRLSNVNIEYSTFGLPTPTGGVTSNIQVVPINGENGNTSNAEGEGDIDIQCALAMAPLCNFIIYDDANDSDLISVLTREQEDNLADVVSESYGWSAESSFYLAAHNLHLTMNAQGMTYMCAAGDTGTQIQSTPYPDMDPEVLVVGGTSVTTNNAGNRSFESAWVDGGGGWSPTTDPFNLLPSYQTGSGVPTNIPYRLVPDVSLDADPNTGYEIVIGGQLQNGWGGTSCAAPTFTGSLAVCEQQIIAGGGLLKNSAGKQRFGRINDLIYSYNGNSTIFYDITQGSNGQLPNGQTSNAGKGWDMASGWGTMIFSGFVDKVLSLSELTQVSATPTSVLGGASSQGTVTLGANAPAGGTVVNLASSSSAATVPASVTVAAGSNTANFTITTSTVSAITSATISASAEGTTLTTTLTVTPILLTKVSESPASVVGGNTSTGTLTLNGPAPAAGMTVQLKSSSSTVVVPATVTIPGGSSTATFTVSTKAVTASSAATITAVVGISTEVSTFTVVPPSLQSVTLSQTSVAGGTVVSGTVALNGAAPAAGYTVNLSSSTSNATVLASVKIPSGATSATFSVTTKAVATPVTASIIGKQGLYVYTATLTIQPATLVSVNVAPSTVVGGKTAVGTVALSGPAPAAGMTITLSSSSTSSATVLATVKVASGAKTGTFTITSKAVSVTTPVTITGTLNGISQQGTVTVQAPSLVSVAVKPGSVKGSSRTAVSGTVTISSVAPVGGLVLSLSSSNTDVVGIPGTVKILAGNTSATFVVTHTTVSTQTPVTITANFGNASKTTSLTITP